MRINSKSRLAAQTDFRSTIKWTHCANSALKLQPPNKFVQARLSIDFYCPIKATLREILYLCFQNFLMNPLQFLVLLLKLSKEVSAFFCFTNSLSSLRWNPQLKEVWPAYLPWLLKSASCTRERVWGSVPDRERPILGDGWQAPSRASIPTSAWMKGTTTIIEGCSTTTRRGNGLW